MYETLCFVMKYSHGILFLIGMNGSLYTQNKLLLLFFMLFKIGTILSWRYHRGCILTTFENKIKKLMNEKYDYVGKQQWHLNSNIPYTLYFPIIILICFDLFKLSIGKIPNIQDIGKYI